MGKSFEQTLDQRRSTTASKHGRTCSTSSVVRETRLRPIRRHVCPPITMAATLSAAEDVEERDSEHRLCDHLGK